MNKTLKQLIKSLREIGEKHPAALLEMVVILLFLIIINLGHKYYIFVLITSVVISVKIVFNYLSYADLLEITKSQSELIKDQEKLINELMAIK